MTLYYDEAMTYSTDFRKKVLSIRKRDHLTFDEAAARFDIGRSTLIRWSKSLEPKTRVRTCLKIANEKLLADVKVRPDDYHYERAARFGCSPTGICKALHRCGIRRKKRH